jgi:hypothetical protein
MYRHKFALAAIAGVVATTLGVHGYTTYGKWADNEVPFYINPANADVSEAEATAAVQVGLNEWSTKAGTPFRYLYAGRVNDTTTGYDNRNVVLFRNSANPGGTSIVATTYWWTYSGGRIVDADIVFWDGSWAFFAGTTGCSGGAYIEDVAAHELGHALGLNHSSASDATMNAGYSKCSQHMRSLAPDDIAGAQSLYGSASAPANSAPLVSISSPGNNASVGEGAAVLFAGSANDAEDGSLTSRLAWTSSLDGPLGTGGSFTRVLSVGTHTIRATATDSGGLDSSRQVTVTVAASAPAPTNTAPAVRISSPAGGTSYTAATTILFSGSAEDEEDGTLTSRMTWTSSLDGTIGSGGSFNRALSAGTHVVTASVRDSGGLSGSRQVTITVAAATAPASSTTTPTLTASSHKVKGSKRADLRWSGLTSTSVDVYRNGIKVVATGNDGAYLDVIDVKRGGSYVYKVCATGTATCSNQASVSF